VPLRNNRPFLSLQCPKFFTFAGAASRQEGKRRDQFAMATTWFGPSVPGKVPDPALNALCPIFVRWESWYCPLGYQSRLYPEQ